MERFLSQIRKSHGTLTGAEKKIAEYVLQYPSETVNLSASALARQAGTAASAVVRFCRSIGFGGYSEFKVWLAVELSRHQPSSYMSGVAPEDTTDTIFEKILTAHRKALLDTLERMDRADFSRAVELLSGADRVFIYGIGTSAGLVGELQHRLMLLGMDVHGYTDTVSMRLSTLNLGPGDVIFGISHSGRTMAVVDALTLARQAGAKTICLTSYGASPITKGTDQVLTVFCEETQYPIEASTARIAQTAVVDALVAALSARQYERAQKRSGQIHDLLEDIRYKERRGKK